MHFILSFKVMYLNAEDGQYDRNKLTCIDGTNKFFCG
jgi:hypothetical protein